MLRIQVPGITKALNKLLELTSPPELELGETVTPVIIVGGAAVELIQTGLNSFYSAEGVATPRVPDLYGQVGGGLTSAGVTGYMGLRNDTVYTFRVRRVYGSSETVQTWLLSLYQPGHAMPAAGVAATRRDSRAVVPTPTTNANTVTLNIPAGGAGIAQRRALVFDYGEEIVLGPGSALTLSVIAAVQTYQHDAAFEMYRIGI